MRPRPGRTLAGTMADRSVARASKSAAISAALWIPFVPVLLEAPGDDRAERRRDRRRQGRRLIPHDAGAQLEPRRGVERERAGGHLVKHHPEGPDVAPGVGGLAAKDLGRGVMHRSDERPRLRERAPRRGAFLRAGVGHELGQAEVEDLDPRRGDHDVGALQVAMDDALLVGVLESRGDLETVTNGIGGRQRPRGDGLLERAAGDVLHGDKGRPVFLADLMDDADVRMAEGGCHPGLAEETGAVVGIADEIGREEFDRDGPLELKVLRLEDQSHPAPADLPDHPVFSVDDPSARGSGSPDRDRPGMEGRRAGRAIDPRAAPAAERGIRRIVRLAARAAHFR